jgi:hypothetical protein
MSEFFKRILIATIAIGAIALLPGCAGTVKKTNADGSEVSTPAHVAVIQASAQAHETCGTEQIGFTLSVDEISKLSASAQAEAMRNVPMMALLGYIQQKEGGGCHSQIAAATREYFKSQAIKYQQFGMVGRAGVIGGFTYLGARAFFQSISAMNAGGDTHIGEVNVSGATDGASGEGAMTGGSVTQNVNLGNGSLTNAAEGGVNAFGEKPILGDGNTFDDSGDGSNNNPGFFN